MKIKNVYLRYYSGNRKPRIIFVFADGSQRGFAVVSGDKPTAEKLLNYLRIKLDMGLLDPEKYLADKLKRSTLQNLSDLYLKYRSTEAQAGRISPKTHKLDHYALKSFIGVLGANMALNAVNTAQIDRWVESLNMAPATIRLRKQFLATAFQFAVDKGLIDKNPFIKYKHRLIPQRYSPTDKVRYLSDEEISKLRAYLKGWKLDIFNLALWTGMRVGGLFLVNINDLVFQTIDGVDYPFIKTVEKRNKKRWIPLNDKAYSLITRRAAMLNGQNERAAGGFIFFEISSSDAISAAFWRVFHRLFLNPEISFHSTRHTFAVKYLENGGSLHILQSILGHSSIETTRNIYGVDTQRAIVADFKRLSDF